MEYTLQKLLLVKLAPKIPKSLYSATTNSISLLYDKLDTTKEKRTVAKSLIPS